MMITGLYAGILGLIFVVLSFAVIRKRMATKVSLGDGGDGGLQEWVRIHGNFAEYVPLAVILLGYVEMTGFYGLAIIHAMGIALVAGRLSHIYGMCPNGNFIFRVFGMLLTLGVIVTLSVILIMRYVTA